MDPDGSPTRALLFPPDNRNRRPERRTALPSDGQTFKSGSVTRDFIEKLNSIH